MTDISSCKTCRYFDSKDWNNEDKNWCRYNDLPAINEGLCGYYEPMIKPCPFCGCPVKVFVSIYGVHGAKDYYAIAHPDGTNCIVDGMETSSYNDKEELIHDWNRRVKE